MQSHKKFNYRTMMGCLVINGKRYPVYEGINTIGRCMTATVPLKSLDISKQHAIITIVDNNTHYISDFQSFNGTFLEKSKLSPLLLYKLSQDSVIEFANVTATYNQISKETTRDDNSDIFHNTQIATDTLYEATTQAVEDDIPYHIATENIEEPNNFDDDYSFDDISTQIINETRSKSPVFKVPVSINDALTQKLCENDSLHVTENVIDIHNMETQKLEITSKIEDVFPNINDLPTQILSSNKEQEDFDCTSVVDATVLDFSEIEVAEVTIKAKEASEDSDSQSKLHISQLHRRSIKPIVDTEEDLFDNSEVIADTQSSEEIIPKTKKRVGVIESDNETDIEDLDENLKSSRENDSGSDTDVEGLEKHISSNSIINDTVQKPVTTDPASTTVSSIDSDTDIDDFEFNPKEKNVENLDADLDDYRSNKSDGDCFDEVIPGTQFQDEDVLDENTIAESAKELKEVLNNTKCYDSVGMDSLYLEPTQSLTAQDTLNEFSHLPTESDSTRSGQKIVTERTESVEIEKENLIVSQPSQLITLEKSASLGEDDRVFLKPSDPISKDKSEGVKLITNTSIQHLESRVNKEALDDKCIYESLTQDILFLQRTQPISNIEKALPTTVVEDGIFEQATQPIASFKSQLEDCNTDEIFMQPTQALESVSNKDQLTQLISENESEDALFLQPTQCVINTNDDIFMQPTQVLKSNTDTDIFLKPTQPITPKPNSMALKQSTSADEIKGNSDEDIENKFEKMFASQNDLPQNSEFESQLEVVFESQNVSYRSDVSDRPLNPLLNTFESKRNEFLNSEELICNVENTGDKDLLPEEAFETFIGNTSEKAKVIPRKVSLETDQIVDFNTNKCHEDVNLQTKADSSTDNKQRKSTLSLRKNKINELDEDVEECNVEPNVPLKELLPIEKEQESKQEINLENIKNTKKFNKVKSKREKTPPKPLENVAINADIEEIESENTITWSTRTTRSKINSTSKVMESTEKKNKGKVLKNKSNNNSDSSAVLVENTVKTRPKRNVKTTKNVVIVESSVSGTENVNGNVCLGTGDDLDSIADKVKRRSAKIRNMEESNAKITTAAECSNRSVKINIPDDVFTAENASEVSSTGSKKSRTKMVKGENINLQEKDALAKKEKEESDCNNKTIKTSDTVNTKQKVATSKKQSKNVSKSKKIDKNDSLVANESNGVNDAFSDIDHLSNSSTKNLTNKRKSTEDEKNSPTKTNESETSISRKRTRRVGVEELDPQTSSSSRNKKRILDNGTPTFQLISETCSMGYSSPNRNRRKQKPKVVFTLLDSPELESVIRSLGGTVVNSVECCTVLVTGALKRTQKLLSAVGQGKPICSPKWLQECKKASQFLDPWDHILKDEEAEDNWKLSLKVSLNRSQNQKLFQDYTVYLAVTTSVDVLRAAVEACGGKCVTKAPSKVKNENFLVVANPENKSKYAKFLNRDPPVTIVLPEAILDGVLRQELR
ncbi:hypothetical protein RN001_002041 [Aquatica leii]|uniref:Mediator of DNA damage checkpoint protein 1 n=1 Tax=Aquatica leii TaxID=1421715 RepID=A0AAN7QAU7_9COLE|nr:hypothetical protein RN001_002041 [Aquatica leii]